MLTTFRRYATTKGRIVPASPELCKLLFHIDMSTDLSVAQVEVTPGQGLKPVPLWIRTRDFPAGFKPHLFRAGTGSVREPLELEIVVAYLSEAEQIDVKRIWIPEESREVRFFANEDDARA